MSKLGMGGHQQTIGKNQEWLTDPAIIKALGPFDLDPCAPVVRPWDMAAKHYTKEDDGLKQPWRDVMIPGTVTNHNWETFPTQRFVSTPRIWLNPPYDRRTIELWLKLIADHGNGISFLFARTETKAFQQWIFGYASSILFISGRVTFYDIYGQPVTTQKGEKANGGAPSVLVAYGDNNSQAISESGIKGSHLPVNSVPVIVVGVSPSWTSVVTIALNRTGEADIQTIYSLVEQIAPEKCQNNPHYKEKIRQKLQLHFTRISQGRYTNSKN